MVKSKVKAGMRIADIRTVRVLIPGRFLHLVIVETEGGLVGLGESGLQRRPDAVDGVVGHLSRWLVGEDASRVEHLWQRMMRGGFYPAGDASMAALSAIDIALWDLRGKALGVPVYELLGGRVRDRVECFYNPVHAPGLEAADLAAPGFGAPPEGSKPAPGGTRLRDDVDSAVVVAGRLLEAGHRFIRFAPQPEVPEPGEAPLFDAGVASRRLVDRVAAVRAAEPAIEIMLDVHTRLSLPEARRLLQRLQPFDVYCVEDPLRSESIEAYRSLRDGAGGIPLAMGEQWQGKWRFGEALRARIMDFARPDVCLVGGITEVRKIAAMCEADGVTMLLHNPLGPVCTAASIHLCLALENAGPQEVRHRVTGLPDGLFEVALTEDGPFLTADPDAPGLGVELVEAEAANYAADPTEPAVFVRPDGSYTNY